MRFTVPLLALPQCLLLIINTPILVLSQEGRWPQNLPPDVQHNPEHELLIKREFDIRQKLQENSPVGVRKMSGDPGEKFFLDYWIFDTDDLPSNVTSWTNGSLIHDSEPPLSLHFGGEMSTKSFFPRFLRLPFSPRSIYERDSGQCSPGYFSCKNVSRPNSCCGDGSYCHLLSKNTTLGDVGCCPIGDTCNDDLSPCPTDQTSCPNGGGCCQAGFVCLEVGCVATTTITAPGVPTSTSSSVSIKTVTITVPPSVSSVVTSKSSTIKTTTTTNPPQTVTKTVTEISVTSVLPNSPPVGPTRSSQTSPTTSTKKSVTTSDPGCPTGFYACIAFYQGGCCRTGLDCHSTSCLSTSSTTLISNNGVTIVAPTGSGIGTHSQALTGPCALSWSSCSASVGGGCCPSGYACGDICKATISGEQPSEIGKLSPNAASKLNENGKTTLVLAVTLASSIFSAFF